MSRDDRASDDLAAEVDHVPCPTCGAVAGAPCINPIKDAPSRVPCIQRIRDANAEQDHPDDTVICHEEERNP